MASVREATAAEISQQCVDADVWSMAHFRQAPALDEAAAFGVRPWAMDVRSETAGAKRYGVGGYRAFYATLRREAATGAPLHYYELIRPDVPCHVYLDVDVVAECNPRFRGTDELAALLADFSAFTAALLAERLGGGWVRRMGGGADDCFDWHVTTASSEAKHSFHVVGHLFGGRVKFENNYHAGALVRAFEDAMRRDGRRHAVRDERGEETFMADAAVYTKHRTWRMPYCTKLGQARPLCALDAHGDAEETLEEGAPTFEAYAPHFVCCPPPILRAVLALAEAGGEPVSMRTWLADTTPVARSVQRIVQRRHGVAVQESAVWDAAEPAGAAAVNELVLAALECLDGVARAPGARPDGARPISGDGALNGVPAVVRATFVPPTADEGSGGLRVRTNWRYCHKKGGEHRSNTVTYWFDVERGAYYQSCFSSHDCPRKRSVRRAVPPPLAQRMRDAVAAWRRALVVDFAELLPGEGDASSNY